MENETLDMKLEKETSIKDDLVDYLKDKAKETYDGLNLIEEKVYAGGTSIKYWM